MDALARPVDARGLFFTPLGLGGPIPPDVAQSQAARECDRLRLPASVPAGVSKQFDKVLRLYADGMFAYENYTTASREAYRILEVALKIRFLEHYLVGVPLLRGGTLELVHARNFDDVRARLLRGARLQGHRRFNGSFGALLVWARRERYFFGQRNRTREWAYAQYPQ